MTRTPIFIFWNESFSGFHTIRRIDWPVLSPSRTISTLSQLIPGIRNSFVTFPPPRSPRGTYSRARKPRSPGERVSYTLHFMCTVLFFLRSSLMIFIICTSLYVYSSILSPQFTHMIFIIYTSLYVYSSILSPQLTHMIFIICTSLYVYRSSILSPQFTHMILIIYTSLYVYTQLYN